MKLWREEKKYWNVKNKVTGYKDKPEVFFLKVNTFQTFFVYEKNTEEKTNKKRRKKTIEKGWWVCEREWVNSQHLRTDAPATHKVTYINHSPCLLDGHVSVHKSNAVLPKG